MFNSFAAKKQEGRASFILLLKSFLTFSFTSFSSLPASLSFYVPEGHESTHRFFSSSLWVVLQASMDQVVEDE